MAVTRDGVGGYPLRTPMFGRDAERQQISTLLERTLARETVVLLLEGGAGTGKTRLLQELVSAARPAGLTVIEGGVPFPPQPVPMVLVHDDAQWADLSWLPRVTTADRPWLCAVAYRPAANGAPLSSLLALTDQPTVRVELGPLPSYAVRQLVTHLVGGEPRPELLTQTARASGNPLLVTELVKGMRDEGQLVFDGGQVGLRTAELPRRLRAVVQRQLNELSPRSRQLLQVASAVGYSFALSDVAEMLRETTASLLPALEEALLAGILVCNTRRLTFSNELVCEVVKQSLPVSVRHELDREVGRLLMTRGGSVPHAGEPAAVAEPPTGPDQVVGAVGNQLALGHLASAVASTEDALSRPVPPPLAAELRSRLAHILLMGGRADQALITAEQLLREPDLPAHVREGTEAAGILALSLRDPEAAVRRARALLAEQHRRDGDPAVITAATVVGGALWEAGDLAGSLEESRGAVARIRPTTPSSWRTNARLALARKLSNCRAFREAEALIKQAESDNQHGLTVHSAAPQLARARLLAQAGRTAEARAEASSAHSRARELGAQLLLPLSAAVLALVALRSGDLLAAAEYVRRYQADLASGISPLRSVLYDWVALLLAAEQEGPRRAVELLCGECAWLTSQPALFAEEPGAAAWLVRHALAVGQTEVAHTAAATVARLADANPGFVAVAGAAIHARGLVDRDVGALAQAARQQQDLWARALAEEDLAAHLEIAASSAEAVAALEAALQSFEQIGCQRDSARIRSRLRAFGVRRRAAPLPRCAGDGWQSLSDTERTISHLVNQGLTNRQIARRVFLSPHTVNYHLRQIFRKLDVTSRVDLARVTQEQYLAVDGACSQPPAGDVDHAAPDEAGAHHTGQAPSGTPSKQDSSELVDKTTAQRSEAYSSANR